MLYYDVYAHRYDIVFQLVIKISDFCWFKMLYEWPTGALLYCLKSKTLQLNGVLIDEKMYYSFDIGSIMLCKCDLLLSTVLPGLVH